MAVRGLYYHFNAQYIDGTVHEESVPCGGAEPYNMMANKLLLVSRDEALSPLYCKQAPKTLHRFNYDTESPPQSSVKIRAAPAAHRHTVHQEIKQSIGCKQGQCWQSVSHRHSLNSHVRAQLLGCICRHKSQDV